MEIASYYVSFSDAATCEVGVIEFDTHEEAAEEYDRRLMAGYAVKISVIDVFSDLADEVRKSEGYEDRTEAVRELRGL